VSVNRHFKKLYIVFNTSRLFLIIIQFIFKSSNQQQSFGCRHQQPKDNPDINPKQQTSVAVICRRHHLLTSSADINCGTGLHVW
jgi:hypothetical protein